MRFKFKKKDSIFWICITGAIVSLILKLFHSSYLGELSLAFIVGCLLHLYSAIGEIRGKLALLPTSEEVRRIIREELSRRESKDN